jgi:hypothetical protein
MSTETQDKTDDKIKIEWDDLKTRKVDQRLKEQEAVERNRRQAEISPLVTTAATPQRTSIWYNSVFMMACFGLLGGLLAWGGGEILRYPDPRFAAEAQVREVNDLLRRQALGEPGTETAIKSLKQEYAGNPFFVVETEDKPAEQIAIDRAAVEKQQAMKRFISNLIAFGLSGMLIAACLSAAEKIVDRNYSQALVNGCVGAALGLIGGAFVSLFFTQLYDALRGAPVIAGAATTGFLAQLLGYARTLSQKIGPTAASTLAHSISWGVLGLFLTIGPGIMMRNLKKLRIGLLGGVIGGVIGGALYDPIFSATNGSEMAGRLAALLAIGLFAGLGTGLIENAAKSGWLKVTAGLIAGKQFILYRSPTFIGSGPECPIYLFRDPKVGKRHAALYIVPGGFELENLPMGTDTLVNGKPINRTRLRAGDSIQVGGTAFLFQEKVRV